MRRPPSHLLRLARALIGLVTVWCLGCQGYEPLIDAVLDVAGAPMMSSASGDGAPSMTAAQANGEQAAMHEVGSPRRSFDCGCGSCHAPSPVRQHALFVRPLAVTDTPWHMHEPSSESRIPLLPPPELAG